MTIDHAQPIRHTCAHCGHCWFDSLPRLVCVRCLSHQVRRNSALLHWIAAELDQQAIAVIVDQAVLDPAEAFRPGSAHFGSNVSPVAEVQQAEREGATE